MNMKMCLKCEELKPLAKFRKWRTACKDCENAYSREYHAEHKKDINTNKVRKNMDRYHEKRKYLVKYLKDHPCVDCGESRVACLEFDHVRGEKKDKISSLLSSGWNVLLEEVGKCDVRCANCHAIITARRAGRWWVDE